MNKQRICELKVYSKRWAAISLIENLENFHSKNKITTKMRISKRDNTDFFPHRQKNSKRFDENPSLILMPENFFKLIWDTMKLLLILIESILIPYMLAFIPPYIKFYQSSIIAIEVFFIFDMVIAFNTAIYFKGKLFKDRRFIAKNYLKTTFLIDIFAVFPFCFVISDVNLTQEHLFYSVSDKNALKSLWLLKLLRLNSTKKIFYSLEDFFVNSAFLNPIRGLHFLFSVFIWTHWLACILYYQYAWSLAEEASLWKKFVDDVSDRYLRSVYLVLQTMTSVGFGDILPVSSAQRILAVVSMFFACALFGNILGNLQGFIQNWNADGKFYEEKIRQLKVYLKKNNLPLALRHRVVQYIYYIEKVKKKSNLKELEILDILSKPLREEIFTITRGDILAKSAVFKCFSGAFLKFLGHQMKVETFATGDIIFKEGEISTVLYYLCSGKVQIYHEQTKTVFKDIKTHKYFGEISFFLNQPRTASAMCIEFGEFLILNRTDFFNILEYRPKEKELTSVITYNCIKYNDLTLLKIRCYLCNAIGHVAKNCKAYVYDSKVNKEIVKNQRGKNGCRAKLVNTDLESPGMYKRQIVTCDSFRRFNLANSKGNRFRPECQFNGRKQLVSKANSVIAGTIDKSDDRKLFTFVDRSDSESF